VKEVKPGEFVYFDKISGSELRVKGKKYKAIREQDVVVTMKDVNTVI
jgi:co-chaperonin GroES (HSP10)